jgi:mRNA interferase RelE/StbE
MSDIEQVISTVGNSPTIKNIPELRKLKGGTSGIYYRIRVGAYRIGITIDNEIVTFVRILHRKDIYRHFP